MNTTVKRLIAGGAAVAALSGAGAVVGGGIAVAGPPCPTLYRTCPSPGPDPYEITPGGLNDPFLGDLGKVGGFDVPGLPIPHNRVG